MAHDGIAQHFPCVIVAQTSQGSQQVHMTYDPLFQLGCGGFKAAEALWYQTDLFVFSHISFFPSSGAMWHI